jgi:hypothetical protein
VKKTPSVNGYGDLIVGMGAAIPSAESDVRLEDVVVSSQIWGIVEWFSMTLGRLRRVDSLRQVSSTHHRQCCLMFLQSYKPAVTFVELVSRHTSPRFASYRNLHAVMPGPDNLFQSSYVCTYNHLAWHNRRVEHPEILIQNIIFT